MNKSQHAVIAAISEMIEGMDPMLSENHRQYIDVEYTKEFDALKNEEDAQVLKDYIPDALYDYRWRMICVLVKMPGFLNYMMTVIPDDYIVDEMWLEDIDEDREVESIKGNIVYSYLFQLFNDDDEDTMDHYRRYYGSQRREKLFEDPMFIDFDNDQIKEYIDEAEGQDGDEYWLNFEVPKALYDDMVLYFADKEIPDEAY